VGDKTVCVVVFAGQLGAIVGTVIELTHGVAEMKRHQLHSLGFDPIISVTINLIYSTAAFSLFCWLTSRWNTERRKRKGAG
jgi:hypothetical protein